MKFNYRRGILLALGTAFFSGMANFVNKFALTAVGNPLLHTTLKNSLVALMIFGILIFLRKLEYIRKLSRRDFMLLIAIGVVGSIAFK